ncbi:MAG: ABC transporter permease [Elusimicrobia bacterium]|nr:ABC transporter permease [Candidatus Obscuribacterium magneticum]
MSGTLIGFLKKELAQVLRDPKMRFVLFGVPILQMILFGYAISTEVKNVKIAGYFPPEDRLSREFLERSLASGWFLSADGYETDPYVMVQAGKAGVVIVAPPGGLTKAVQRGEGKVQLLVDATNTLRARSVEVYLKNILASVVRDYLHGDEASTGIKLEMRVLYNPAMKSAVFMVPGVMCMILCVVTILLTSMSLAREKELGTFETLISSPVGAIEILLGKTLPFVLLALIDLPLVLSVAVFLFGVPMKGPLFILFLAGFIFICTTVSIGTLISTFSRTQQQAMMGGFLFLFPAILLSGIMYPLENMPKALFFVTYLNPLKYFVVLLRNLMLKGGDVGVIWSNMTVLVLIACSVFWVAFKRFRMTLQ